MQVVSPQFVYCEAFEELVTQPNFNEETRLFTVGIIGQQSTSKSTLLNDLFGSCFQVKKGNCKPMTKGVWASLIDDTLVLDSEGQDSDDREGEEDIELKIAMFVVAASQTVILNMDAKMLNTRKASSFNLLKQVMKAAAHIYGVSVKKRVLFALRDINDFEGLAEEVKTKIANLNTQMAKEMGSAFRSFDELFDYEVFEFPNKLQTSTDDNGKTYCQTVEALKRHFFQTRVSDAAPVGLLPSFYRSFCKKINSNEDLNLHILMQDAKLQIDLQQAYNKGEEAFTTGFERLKTRWEGGNSELISEIEGLLEEAKAVYSKGISHITSGQVDIEVLLAKFIGEKAEALEAFLSTELANTTDSALKEYELECYCIEVGGDIELIKPVLDQNLASVLHAQSSRLGTNARFESKVNSHLSNLRYSLLEIKHEFEEKFKACAMCLETLFNFYDFEANSKGFMSALDKLLDGLHESIKKALPLDRGELHSKVQSFATSKAKCFAFELLAKLSGQLIADFENHCNDIDVEMEFDQIELMLKNELQVRLASHANCIGISSKLRELQDEHLHNLSASMNAVLQGQLRELDQLKMFFQSNVEAFSSEINFVSQELDINSSGFLEVSEKVFTQSLRRLRMEANPNSYLSKFLQLFETKMLEELEPIITKRLETMLNSRLDELRISFKSVSNSDSIETIKNNFTKLLDNSLRLHEASVIRIQMFERIFAKHLAGAREAMNLMLIGELDGIKYLKGFKNAGIGLAIGAVAVLSVSATPFVAVGATAVEIFALAGGGAVVSGIVSFFGSLVHSKVTEPQEASNEEQPQESNIDQPQSS
mmetsp:Transcript_6541/g.11456  ORF Transcript_6541/g.11456 Transcript_6541/m.11456 type:complete len:822 (-) Transcript_6541:147-2612(-)